MGQFKVVSDYTPSGDQPQAIDTLASGIENGLRDQVLLGVTGSGKTYTMAKVIERVQRPTLVLAHNKTLAAQLCEEFRAFFPENAVEYFVSYYDYYQPEAYIPHTDTFIEKDAAINDEIERLRHSATAALFERRDVIVVSSVSCIYGLGDPIDYANMVISLRQGKEYPRDQLLRKLVEIRYERNDIAFDRNMFRVRGDTVEIYPVYANGYAIRVEFFGDEVDRISEINPVTGQAQRVLQHVAIYPASHYVTTKDKMERAAVEIERELAERKKWFEDHGKLIEAQRIDQRTRYDLEMMRELGYCTGIENYSRVISGRVPGSPPTTLLDYFPEDFLLFVDESHVTLPQVRAMYNGDRARKESLVEYGFRLPCAFDNRPLKFPEFEERYHQAVFVSATPGDYEREHADQVAEQVIRPTGLLDPRVEVRPVEGQIDVTLKRTEKIMTKTASLVLQIAQNEEFEGVPRNVYRFLISDGTAACPYWWYYSATQQWYQYTGEFRQDKYRKLLELYHGIAESNPTLYASMVEQYGENIDNDYYTGLNGQQLRMSMGFMVNRQNPHKMAWLRYVLCPLFDYYSTNYPDLEYYTTGSVNVTTGGWRDPANNY